MELLGLQLLGLVVPALMITTQITFLLTHSMISLTGDDGGGRLLRVGDSSEIL